MGSGVESLQAALHTPTPQPPLQPDRPARPSAQYAALEVPQARSESALSITFTPTNPWPADGSIEVILPVRDALAYNSFQCRLDASRYMSVTCRLHVGYSFQRRLDASR